MDAYLVFTSSMSVVPPPSSPSPSPSQLTLPTPTVSVNGSTVRVSWTATNNASDVYLIIMSPDNPNTFIFREVIPSITSYTYDNLNGNFYVFLTGTINSVSVSSEEVHFSAGSIAPPPSPSPSPPEAPNLHTASVWARTEIQSAFEKGFLPNEILNSYGQYITRGEFVRLAMSYLRYKTGMTNAQLVAAHATHPNRIFTDVPNDSCLQAAGKLGITSGTGGTEPNRVFGDGLFDREMAAFMLRRVHIIVNGGSDTVPDQGYNDMNEARWHQGAVNYVIHHGIMQGTNPAAGIFSPKSNFTRQQSILTFDRMG
jgi:hypothetical protein